MKPTPRLSRPAAPEAAAPNYDLVSELDGLRADFRDLIADEAAAIAGSQIRRYSWLKAIFVIIEQLRTDDEAWRMFSEPAVWEGVGSQPDPKNRTRPERWAVLRAIGPQTRQDRQLVSKYAAALEELAVRQTQVSTFVRAIEDAGGIEALARMAAKRRGGGRGARETNAVRLRCTALAQAFLESLDEGAIVPCQIKASRAGRGVVFSLLDPPLGPRE